MKFDLGESWFKNGKDLKRAILGNMDPKNKLKFLEIGSYKGRSTIWFIENFLSAEGSEIHCVDPWEENDLVKLQKKFKAGETGAVYDQFIYNIEFKGFRDKCTVYRMRSADASVKFKDGDFDFIYIDGDHSFGGCYEDLLNYWPKLKKGGVLFGDDWQYSGIRKAAVRFARESGKKLHFRFYIPHLLNLSNGFYFINN